MAAADSDASIPQLSFIANSVVYRCFRYSAPHATNSTLLLVVSGTPSGLAIGEAARFWIPLLLVGVIPYPNDHTGLHRNVEMVLCLNCG
jgi:hypothetical protein